MTETAIITLEEASREIDNIVEKCGPLALEQAQNFSAALGLAEGVKSLRQIFLTHPGIKETVESMQDTRLGFLTDRSPKAIARAKRDSKTLVPYSYEEVAECCIEAMLKGYRITNNEFNIIASGFYPAKNGKYRKIIEYPGVSDFRPATTSPQPDGDRYAKVQCWASWKKEGARVSIGFADPEKEVQDTLVFKIRVNRAMGEDAIVGKALSKLFSRVLMRIEGKILPESSDLEFGVGEVVDAEFTEKREKVETDGLGPDTPIEATPYDIKGAVEETTADDDRTPESTTASPPLTNQPVGNTTTGLHGPEAEGSRNEEELSVRRRPQARKRPPVPDDLKDYEQAAFDQFRNLGPKSYSTYVHKRSETINRTLGRLHEYMIAKWARFYTEPCPIGTVKDPIDEAKEGMVAHSETLGEPATPDPIMANCAQMDAKNTMAECIDWCTLEAGPVPCHAFIAAFGNLESYRTIPCPERDGKEVPEPLCEGGGCDVRDGCLSWAKE